MTRVIEMLNRIAEIKKEIQSLNEQGLKFAAELKSISTDLHLLADKIEEIPEKIETLNQIDISFRKIRRESFCLRIWHQQLQQILQIKF